MNKAPFLKQQRSKEVTELMKNPACFMLLTQIAQRAKRTNELNIDNLKIGEAKVGDYKEIGLTEQRYKTAKCNLQKWGLATFQATNKGTIARLTDTRVYNINIDATNEQTNEQLTSQQRTTNEQLTTNKNDKNDKKEEEIKNKETEEEKKKINLAFAECLQVIEIAKNFNEYSPAYIFENKTTNAVVLGMGGIREISKTTIDSYWKHDFEKTWKVCKQMGKTSTKASGNLKKNSGKFKLIREDDAAYGKEEVLIDNKIEIIPEAKI